MATIENKLDQKGEGAFKLYEDGKEVGEMVASVNEGLLTVSHTEVIPEKEGKGYAKQLLDEVVNYARAQNLMIVPLCSYVHAQFRNHPDQYQDIWKKPTN